MRHPKRSKSDTRTMSRSPKTIITALTTRGFLTAGMTVLTVMLSASLAEAQVADPTGIKRAFLDRYLDCAEAPGAAARLECYDALLVDIPAWLDEASDSQRSLPWVDHALLTTEYRDGCGQTDRRN